VLLTSFALIINVVVFVTARVRPLSCSIFFDGFLYMLADLQAFVVWHLAFFVAVVVQNCFFFKFL